MAVAGPSFWNGVNASCDALLVRVVMGWMSVFGLLLLMAELGARRARHRHSLSAANNNNHPEPLHHSPITRRRHAPRAQPTRHHSLPGVEVIRTHVHVLAYRTGRAAIALFASTICLAAAPSEVAIAGISPGRASSLVTQVDWQFAGVGLLLGFSAFYALRLSARAKLQKLGQKRTSKAPAAGTAKELM